MRQKLEGFYGGVADMPKAPDAVFILDTHVEHVAATESKKAGIPTVGITDTNADPTIIDYPIPANDDAVGSIKLLTDYIFDAWLEGRKAKNTKEEGAGDKEKPVKEETKGKEEKKVEVVAKPQEKAAAKPAESKEKPVEKKTEKKKE